jgi:CheY-like chemotaxis protein
MSKKQVLVVDDMTHIREIISKIFRQKDYEITQATNGEEALLCLQQQRENFFDVITMDYQMPFKNGAETIEAIRKQNIKTPIICISASLRRMRQELMQKNVQDENLYYIDKDNFTEELPGVIVLVEEVY